MCVRSPRGRAARATTLQRILLPLERAASHPLAACSFFGTADDGCDDVGRDGGGAIIAARRGRARGVARVRRLARDPTPEGAWREVRRPWVGLTRIEGSEWDITVRGASCRGLIEGPEGPREDREKKGREVEPRVESARTGRRSHDGRCPVPSFLKWFEGSGAGRNRSKAETSARAERLRPARRRRATRELPVTPTRPGARLVPECRVFCACSEIVRREGSKEQRPAWAGRWVREVGVERISRRWWSRA